MDSDTTVESGAIVLRKPVLRAGWAEAAKSLAAQGGDVLWMGAFANDGDAEFAWKGTATGTPVADAGQ